MHTFSFLNWSRRKQVFWPYLAMVIGCAVFTEAQNRVNEVFARTTLADLLHPNPRATRRVKTAAAVN